MNKNEAGIITDSDTGLEWFVGPDRDTNHYEAEEWVKGLTVDGGGWRLPTIKELCGLYRPGASERNLDPVFDISEGWVWSGEIMKDPPRARYFLFIYGVNYLAARGGRGVCLRAFAVRQGREK